MDNLQVWQARCDALINHLGNLAQSDEIKGIPREATIKALLQNLREFGFEHFRFFFNDFTHAREEAKLTDQDNAFPKAAVLRWITDQISYDLDVIKRAWNQRRSNSMYLNEVSVADKLGILALQPAKNCGFISSDTTVLSYFQKSYSVRLVPYANVALVGIPITALNVPRDYLAIPHEVAHFVFRHGTKPANGQYVPRNPSISTILTKVIKQLLPEEYDFMQHWVEEMFADMYGCLVAGPVIALDFQDLQMDDSLKEFANATIDRADPVPLLRPDTYAKVLAKSSNEKWTTLAPLLHERWQSFRKVYWENFYNNHREEFRSDANLDLKIPAFVAKVRAKVEANEIRSDTVNLESGLVFDEMIDAIWEQFIQHVDAARPIGTVDESIGEFSWSGNDFGKIKSWRDTEKLYDSFGQAVEALRAANVSITESSSFTPQNQNSNIWIDWVNKFEKRKMLKNWKRDLPKDAKRIFELEGMAKPESEKAYGWYELAYADGWVTRGPEPNPVGD